MAVAIYKPGQGYWVRVMTAVFAGALVLATAAWAASQAELIKPPLVGYDVTVVDAESSIAEGATIQLYEDVDGSVDAIGSTTVLTTSNRDGSEVIRVADPDLNADRFLGDANRLRAEGGFSAKVLGRPTPAYAFNPVYLQGGAAGLVMLLGALVIYWHVALRKPSVDFLVNTDNEMKKVNWSTRREVIGSTWVVVAASLLIAAALFVVDLMFQQFFSLVGVLETG